MYKKHKKKHKKNIYLEVDGGVNPLNIKNLVQSGANLIVAGNAIFKDGKDFYESSLYIEKKFENFNIKMIFVISISTISIRNFGFFNFKFRD